MALFSAICPGCNVVNKHHEHKLNAMVKCPNCKVTYYGVNGNQAYLQERERLQNEEAVAEAEAIQQRRQAAERHRQMLLEQRIHLLITGVALILVILFLCALMFYFFAGRVPTSKPTAPAPVPTTVAPVTKPKPPEQKIFQTDDNGDKPQPKTNPPVTPVPTTVPETKPEPKPEPMKIPPVDNIEAESTQVDKQMLVYELAVYEYLAMVKFDLAQRTSRTAKQLYANGDRQNCFRLDRECGFMYERIIIEYPHSLAAQLTRTHGDARTLASYATPKRPALPSGVITMAKDPKQKFRDKLVIRTYTYKGVEVPEHEVEVKDRGQKSRN